MVETLGENSIDQGSIINEPGLTMSAGMILRAELLSTELDLNRISWVTKEKIALWGDLEVRSNPSKWQEFPKYLSQKLVLEWTGQHIQAVLSEIDVSILADNEMGRLVRGPC